MSNEAFKIVPTPPPGAPRPAGLFSDIDKVPAVPAPPPAAAPGPPTQRPIDRAFGDGRKVATNLTWILGAFFLFLLLVAWTPYRFQEDRFNGKSVARGTTTGSLFSPPENRGYAIPHLLAGQFLIELGVLVGITGGALWALGWRPRRGDHI